MSLAGDHIAIASHGLPVEGGHLVLGVGAAITYGAHAQFPLAKAEMHIGGLVFIVVADEVCARIGRQAKVRSRGLVGIYMNSSEGRVDLDILLLAVGVLVHMNAEATRRKSSHRKQSEANGNLLNSLLHHDLRPSCLCYTPRFGGRFLESTGNRPRDSCHFLRQ